MQAAPAQDVAPTIGTPGLHITETPIVAYSRADAQDARPPDSSLRPTNLTSRLEAASPEDDAAHSPACERTRESVLKKMQARQKSSNIRKGWNKAAKSVNKNNSTAKVLARALMGLSKDPSAEEASSGNEVIDQTEKTIERQLGDITIQKRQVEECWARMPEYHKGSCTVVFHCPVISSEDEDDILKVLSMLNKLEQNRDETEQQQQEGYSQMIEEIASEVQQKIEELYPKHASNHCSTRFFRLVTLLQHNIAHRGFSVDEHLVYGSAAALNHGLTRALQQHQPRILHVCVPEGQTTLSAIGADGTAVAISEDDLVAAITGGPLGSCSQLELEQRPMLIHLGYPNSAGLAEKLIQAGIPCTLGWNGLVTMDTLEFFTHCFYRSLEVMDNSSVAVAFHHARNQTFNKQMWSLGRIDPESDKQTHGSPILCTVSPQGFLCAFSDENPGGMTTNRIIPSGMSIEKHLDPLLGVLPFLGPAPLGAEARRSSQCMTTPSYTAKYFQKLNEFCRSHTKMQHPKGVAKRSAILKRPVR